MLVNLLKNFKNKTFFISFIKKIQMMTNFNSFPNQSFCSILKICT